MANKQHPAPRDDKHPIIEGIDTYRVEEGVRNIVIKALLRTHIAIVAKYQEQSPNMAEISGEESEFDAPLIEEEIKALKYVVKRMAEETRMKMLEGFHGWNV